MQSDIYLPLLVTMLATCVLWQLLRHTGVHWCLSFCLDSYDTAERLPQVLLYQSATNHKYSVAESYNGMLLEQPCLIACTTHSYHAKHDFATRHPLAAKHDLRSQMVQLVFETPCCTSASGPSSHRAAACVIIATHMHYMPRRTYVFVQTLPHVAMQP